MKKKAISQNDAIGFDYYLAIQDVIYLLKCALNEETPDEKQLQCGSKDAVFNVARRHMVTAAVAMALESCGIKSEKTSQMIASAIRKSMLFRSELSNVEKRLHDAGIWYMPLKGIILQHYYPKFGMREMADHDILIDPDRAGDVKDIMESLGFTTEHFGKGNHDVYHKQPILNFEMHTGLFGEALENGFYEYYQNVETRLIKVDEFKRSFTDEDFYIYMIAHEYKHYSGGGTGLRSLADTYIFLNTHHLDLDYVKSETEKLRIREYEAANRSLATHLFGDGELTDEDKEMLNYILSSGVYGTVTHRIENTMKKNNGNKLKYMMNRFFVPVRKSSKGYKAYAEMYPLFYKYKVLLPILPFYRTFRAIKRGDFMKEAKAIKNANNPNNTNNQSDH